MSREIRRVAIGWEHPREGGRLVPLLKQRFGDACREWDAGLAKFANDLRDPETDVAKHFGPLVTQTRAEEVARFIAWDGGPPKAEEHMPNFGDAPLGYCLYEDVSEGTPMSPVFATEAELIDWMVKDGGHDGPKPRKTAEAFVKAGWAPSFMFDQKRGLRSGVDFVGEDDK